MHKPSGTKRFAPIAARGTVRDKAKKHAVAMIKGKTAEQNSNLEFYGEVMAYEQLAL